MVCLASQTDRLTPTPVLAKAADVPNNYLAKVLQMLSSADLVSGRRGVGGGYRLAREANQIRLLDIVNAVDSGKWLRASSVTQDPALGALQRRLEEASLGVVRLLGQTTLDDVLCAADNGCSMVRPLAS